MQYFAYDLGEGITSEPKDLQNDIVFGKADIGYKLKLDAMFISDSNTIFFIEGIDWHKLNHNKESLCIFVLRVKFMNF